MDYNSRATKLETLSREDLKRAAKILKLKGYGNMNKTQLISVIMEAGKSIRKAEYDAESAILKVREALGLSTSGNLKSRTAGLRKLKIALILSSLLSSLNSICSWLFTLIIKS